MSLQILKKSEKHLIFTVYWCLLLFDVALAKMTKLVLQCSATLHHNIPNWSPNYDVTRIQHPKHNSLCVSTKKPHFRIIGAQI